MRVTVKPSIILHKLIDNEFELEVDSYRDIFSALFNMFTPLRAIKNIGLVLLDGSKMVRSYDVDFKPKNNIIHLVPIISGNQTSFDGLGNLLMFYGTSTAIGNEELALTGLNKRILDSSLFGQAQTAFDTAQRISDRSLGISEGTDDPTTGFGSLSIMSADGQNVPLHFGLVRTGGVLINQYIKHIQRGGVDTVRVSDYV